MPGPPLKSPAITQPWENSAPLWFPGAAPQLARSTWRRLRERYALKPESYSTADLFEQGALAARRTWLELPFPSSLGTARGPLLVEAPSDVVQRRFAGIGLILGDTGDYSEARLGASITGALARLAEVPELAQSIAHLVWSLHPILALDLDTDVSFSDPGIPFSIFVSIPPPEDAHADLRLAEGILHEAMHLQLTLIEAQTPLVAPSTEEHYSPWMDRPRPTQGVLHGLYVFGAIRQYLCLIESRSAAEARYLAERTREIGAQIGLALGGLEAGRDLTLEGSALLRRIWRETRPEAAI